MNINKSRVSNLSKITRHPAYTPEQKLWAAVLLRALRDYLNYPKSTDNTSPANYESAKRFLLDETDDGLERVCFWLNIDPDMVRDAVQKKESEGS